MIKVGKNNFEKEVLKSDIPVIVDFNANWCGPCKLLGPIMDDISKEVNVYKVDTDMENTEENEIIEENGPKRQSEMRHACMGFFDCRAHFLKERNFLSRKSISGRDCMKLIAIMIKGKIREMAVTNPYEDSLLSSSIICERSWLPGFDKP